MFVGGRRSFTKCLIGAGSATLCSGFWGGRGASDGKIRIAAVGAGGKGLSDWTTMIRSGKAELVAICDCDQSVLTRIAESKAFKSLSRQVKLERIPFYRDYRCLLKDADKLSVDAMTVSTPAHSHAAVAIGAMQQGIHVYVQFPLVRTLWELDYFGKVAKDNGVVTQMGNQGSSMSGFRRNVEVLKCGVLGDVEEVHVWTNRPVWPQGFAMAKAVSGSLSDPVPPGFDWNSWLATAAERPFKDKLPEDRRLYNPWKISQNVYPFNWRGLTDFGCGALGDMGCHMLNLPFRGLELGCFDGVECMFAEERNDISFPLRSSVKWRFSARMSKSRPGKHLPAVSVYWYDGEQMPNTGFSGEIVRLFRTVPRSGCVIIGKNGMLLTGNDYGASGKIALKSDAVAVNIENHPACADVLNGMQGQASVADQHYIEFLDAVAGKGSVYAEVKSRCCSDIGFSIPFMECILAGVVAQRVGGALSWDSRNRRFDSSVANDYLKPYVRRGFEF